MAAASPVVRVLGPHGLASLISSCPPNCVLRGIASVHRFAWTYPSLAVWMDVEVVAGFVLKETCGPALKKGPVSAVLFARRRTVALTSAKALVDPHCPWATPLLLWFRASPNVQAPLSAVKKANFARALKQETDVMGLPVFLL